MQILLLLSIVQVVGGFGVDNLTKKFLKEKGNFFNEQ
jgi:hypothetical protein